VVHQKYFKCNMCQRCNRQSTLDSLDYTSEWTRQLVWLVLVLYFCLEMRWNWLMGESKPASTATRLGHSGVLIGI
jgi:hypothetical protein